MTIEQSLNILYWYKNLENEALNILSIIPYKEKKKASHALKRSGTTLPYLLLFQFYTAKRTAHAVRFILPLTGAFPEAARLPLYRSYAQL
jgi:hypothetical protein